MNLTTILTAAVGLLAGIIVALKVIAPMTKTKIDDEVLARLEALEALLPPSQPKV